MFGVQAYYTFFPYVLEALTCLIFLLHVWFSKFGSFLDSDQAFHENVLLCHFATQLQFFLFCLSLFMHLNSSTGISLFVN